MDERRHAGVLAHITSLPSPFGVGDIGKECTGRFLNFLKLIDHSLWSLLPLNPPDGVNSPYNGRSTFAGSPVIVAIDELGIECPPPDEPLEHPTNPNQVNFKAVEAYKRKVLWAAFKKNRPTLGTEYEEFKNATPWVKDYGIFMAAAEVQDNNYNWSTWQPDGLRRHDPTAISEFVSKNEELVEYHIYVQYVFFKQLASLKKRANDSGVLLLGDIACYVNYESSDVWANRELFEIDPETLKVSGASGVTPDTQTSNNGQWWGHPVYRWQDNLKPVNDWWVDRLLHSANYFDRLRIDHALGLVSYCTMPSKENPTHEECLKMAAAGVWRKAGGIELFADPRLKPILHQIFLEDRGPPTEIGKVLELKQKMNFPGMTMLPDGFGMHGGKYAQPHYLEPSTYYYLGSHDDPPLRDRLESASPDFIFHIQRYANIISVTEVFEAMLRMAYGSVSRMVLLQMQDVLPYQKGSRMNVPGIQTGQWGWKFTVKDMQSVSPRTIKLLKELTEIYHRK